MNILLPVAIVVLAGVLVPISLVQLLYLEALRLRARELPALTFFKEEFEDRLRLKTDEGALAFSLVKHALLLAMAVCFFATLEQAALSLPVPQLPIWGSLLEATLLSWLAMVVVAHLLPHLLYRRTSGHWLVALLPVLRLAALVSRPMIGLFTFLQALADLSAPEEPKEQNMTQVNDIEALISAGAEEGIIQEGDRKLIQSVVEFGDKRVREVMTPRPNIVAIEETCTLEQLHKMAVAEQYSRFPTYAGDIDHITGFVHVKDLYEIDPAERARRAVVEIRRNIIVVPESKLVEELLRLMQKKGEHMVYVVDEYGQTAGLATMEDLVEEIVGEIRDEHEPAHDVEPHADGSYVVSGNLDLDHLKEMLKFRPDENTESTTVGGLATEWMGHVPKPGESIERGGLRIEVLASDERRVSQVRVSRALVESKNGEQSAA
ncbi:MAG: HlyC/CorC family transporter [Bryobacterales bacterium]|nr:HlyC/CorC family transporter [Bryobacterales bacterium]